MTTNVTNEAQISFRKLWASDTAALKAHLLRLDPESRRMRFGTPVSDYFIGQYAQNALGGHSVAHGYFVDGVLRGVAELRGFRGVAGGEAEAAFSVEKDFQNRGIGTELFGRTVLAARNRGISKLFVNFLSQNARMQAIARKFDAVVTYDSDGGHAQIEAPRANPLSMWKEALTDGQDIANSVMQTTTRALRSA
ncbi:MAG: GNAT family N-acetyltransferase [Xanthobacteraceae bacterium]|nr:GNAT family N-acetyltransferase [Xanthobacteraceae bacterium]MBX3524092.1 GNAT family N-acetyltransferase [Xanthobacteraceae bacterium]MBX3549404.1 GNAT family N-acetyltransferase [Xanthobacteraceae bacterium]MCW5673102.1 GNAT family N-acetyltransferase [Xanthobacteraceae bacterium]